MSNKEETSKTHKNQELSKKSNKNAAKSNSNKQKQQSQKIKESEGNLITKEKNELSTKNNPNIRYIKGKNRPNKIKYGKKQGRELPIIK